MGENSCDYDMMIWTRSNSLFTKTSCSSSEQERAKTIIESAESAGSSSRDIREKLEAKLRLFNISTHFVEVDSKESSRANYTYSSCLVNAGQDYSITVYLA